jgi:hypothetical protein
MAAMEKRIETDGLMIGSRAHPLLPSLDKERLSVLRGLKALGLEEESEGGTSRRAAADLARVRWRRA